MPALFDRLFVAKAERQAAEDRALEASIQAEIDLEDLERERVAAAERERRGAGQARYAKLLQPASIQVLEQATALLESHAALVTLYAAAEGEELWLQGHVMTRAIDVLAACVVGFRADCARAGLLSKSDNLRQQRLDEAAELKLSQVSNPRGMPHHKGPVDEVIFFGSVAAAMRARRSIGPAVWGQDR